MNYFRKVLIIGCGNMGGAMLEGWLAAGEDPARFEVLDPAIANVPDGVTLHREPPVDPDHDCVLLGFKPQQLPALAPGIQSLTGAGVTIFSLLAGVGLAALAESFSNAAAHVRVVPNLAARIGKSPVVLAEIGLDHAARDEALQLFGQLGTALWLDGEKQLNLVTALVGSGPAFVYRFIDALASAAKDLGLSREIAGRLALTTVDGAAALAAQSELTPEQLADRVASPGGITREGLNVLDADGALKLLLLETLRAAVEKGEELGRMAQNQG